MNEKTVKNDVRKSSNRVESQTKRRITRLKTAKDVCHYIASCIRRSEREGGETAEYKKVMMGAMLIKAMETADLEKRLRKLEELAEEHRPEANLNGFTN